MISSCLPASGDAQCNGFDRILILYRPHPEGIDILNDSLRFTLPWAGERGYDFGTIRSSFQSFCKRFHAFACSGVRIAAIWALYLS
jgi:hypothetical protein